MKKLPLVSKIGTAATIKSLLTFENALQAATTISSVCKKVSTTLDDKVIPTLQKIVDKRNS